MESMIPMPSASSESLLQFKESSIHGLGAFAQSSIKEGACVIEYVGQRITKEESSRRRQENNEFIFYLNDHFDLDGNVGWNPAKYINHSCSPNCEAELIEGRIWIVALRDIAPGEELTFNYGFDLEDYRKFPCLCRAPNCVGFIVAETFFGDVRRGKHPNAEDKWPGGREEAAG